jgi:hypothetical protein
MRVGGGGNILDAVTMHAHIFHANIVHRELKNKENGPLQFEIVSE